MKESDITTAILKRLRTYGCYAVKVHGSPLQPATVDILGCRPSDGRFFALEVKRPGQKPTPRQAAALNTVVLAGGIAGVVTSADEADALVFRGA